MKIERAGRRDMDAARRLFTEYAEWLGVDLCFQGFVAEVEGLPWCYAEPKGAIWIAWDGEEPAGCVALRPHEGRECELKRLWVRPAYRNRGLGQSLTTAAMDYARRRRYRTMVLDTLDHMQDAIRLYQRLGFVPCEPYYDNPIPGAVYMRCVL